MTAPDPAAVRQAQERRQDMHDRARWDGQHHNCPEGPGNCHTDDYYDESEEDYPMDEKTAFDLSLRQVYLMTGGHTDPTRCKVLLGEDWRSPADMCQEQATTRVCVDDYRSGIATGGVFTPAETTTRVCDRHADRVRSAPGFRWSRPIENGVVS